MMRALATTLLLAASACSGSDGAAPDAAPGIDAYAGPPLLSVSGFYPTAVTLEQSTCAGLTVGAMPTTVTHVPGSSALTLTHAGNDFPGQVQGDGGFTTTATTVGSAAEWHTLTIAGRFSTTGFDATVSVTVDRNVGSDCDYTVRWVGTRDRGVNVLTP